MDESCQIWLAPRLLQNGQEFDVTTSDTTHGLRYLDAESVRCFTTNLSGFKVCTGDAQALGSVNGVLISPSSRQLRYFVIETAGLFARRYLLPADAGAVFDEVRKTLQIGAKKDELDLQSFKLRSVPQFSDSDLLDTMFSAA
jgi:hypothetical protein